MLIGLIGFWYWGEASSRTKQLADLQADKVKLQKEIASYSETEKRMEAINNWANAEINVLDELYDLVALFPGPTGVRITKVASAPAPQQAPTTPAARTPAAAHTTAPARVTEKPVGKVTLEAMGETDALERLRKALDSNTHWKLQNWEKDTPVPSQAPRDLDGVRAEAPRLSACPGAHGQCQCPARTRRGRRHPTLSTLRPPRRRGRTMTQREKNASCKL